MDELDEKVFDVVLTVIKDSKKIREDYKSKNLQPRFEEKEKIRIQRETLQRKIRTKKSELSKVEEQEIQIEFDVRIGKLTEKKGGSLSQKFKEHIKNISDEINELTSKLDVISNSQGWIDWLDRMSRDLEKVKEYSLEKKREFLLDVLKEIQVQYNPTTQSHKLDIRFLLPLVGDEILYDVDKDEKGFRKYQVREGVMVYQTELDSHVSYTSKNQSYKDKLTERVLHLREVEGLSYERIIHVLNSEGLKPMNGENWYKSRISSFYNYNRKQLPK